MAKSAQEDPAALALRKAPDETEMTASFPHRFERPTRFSFETRDADEMAEVMAPVTGGAEIRAIGHEGFRGVVLGVQTKRAAVFRVEIKGRVVVPVLTRSALSIAIAGRFRSAADPRPGTYDNFAAHLGRAQRPYDLEVDGACLVANLDPALLAAHVRALGGDPSDLRWRPEPRAASRLYRFVDFLLTEIQEDESALHVPWIQREHEETLGALVAHAFLPCKHEDPSNTRRSLHRAEEFLAAHLERPVSLADVARAAEQSVRSVSRAFQREHGMGPIAFLRQRRLEAANRDLSAAEPDATTVTEIALRYGFTHLSHFAGAYRTAFGEAPSATLQRRRGAGGSAAVTPVRGH